jgi:hypothetical protein
VTLIAVVKDDDGHLLVGADSAQVSMDSDSVWASETVRKLSTVGDRPLVWGWSGSSEIGGPFANWILGSDVDWADWATLQRGAQDEVRRLNKQMESQLVHEGQWPTTIVIAGYVEGVQDIWYIDQTNMGMSRKDVGSLFIGSAQHCASIGWTYIKRYQQPNVDEFHNWLSVLSQSVMSISPPVQLWKITPERCQEVRFD